MRSEGRRKDPALPEGDMDQVLEAYSLQQEHHLGDDGIAASEAYCRYLERIGRYDLLRPEYEPQLDPADVRSSREERDVSDARLRHRGACTPTHGGFERQHAILSGG